MTQIFNTDNVNDVQLLLDKHPPENRVEYRRQTVYGSASARHRGLLPVEEVLDRVITFDEVEEVIKHATEHQRFPRFYLQRTWCPKGKRYNQNGLPLCWGWSGVGCMMTRRASMGMKTVLLSPASSIKFTEWKPVGNFLEDFITGAIEDGICEAINGDFNDHRVEKSLWLPKDGERRLHRLDGIIDVNTQASDKEIICQSLTTLKLGLPGYAAYDWWGHAVEIDGWLWMPGEYLNVGAVIHNSHDEEDFIILTGSRCIPSEYYAFGNLVWI